MERYNAITTDLGENHWTVEMVTVCGAWYTPNQDLSAVPCSEERLVCPLPPTFKVRQR